MIESDAMIAIDYQDNNYQLSIYPSKAPVYYNQQLVTKGVFTFQVGDQIVVDVVDYRKAGKAVADHRFRSSDPIKSMGTF